METLIFACVHNAGRSQMAAALFNHLADPRVVRALSAGTQPAARVHPVVVDSMREKGIDLSAATPRKLTPELAADASLLITMGCGEECPYVPGTPVLDWPLPDPKDQTLDAVGAIRDEIERRVRNLIAQNDWSRR